MPDVFEIADEVSPAAKIAYGILFGVLMLSARAGGVGRGVSINAGTGAISIVLVVAFLPEYRSRGFGIGLNGTRFDPLLTAIYLVGGIASGVIFKLAEASCLSRSQSPTPH